MKKLLIVLAFLLALLPRSSSAQMYYFSVPEAEVTVTIGEDGSALIHYALTFHCMDGAHPIDVVDVGMPNMSNHSAIEASVDGMPVPDHGIRTSTYLKPKGSGYEVELYDQTIVPGATGVFEFTGVEQEMVWQDTTDPDQASFRFTPTWFGEEFVSGSTALVLRYRLPIPAGDFPEVEEKILWHKEGEEFSVKGVMEGDDVVSVAWARNVHLTGSNMFSVSFPKKYVTSVRKDSIFGAFYRWFKGSGAARGFGAIIIFVLFGVVFFIATGRTGWSVFLGLCVVLAVLMWWSPAIHVALFPIILALGALVIGLRIRSSKLKPRYFQAEVCLEGGGVKRGLTAVQAAVILEESLSKVLTMVIFGLAKKGALRIKSKEPLMVEPRGQKEGENTWKLPDGKIVKLRSYEPVFLAAFEQQDGISVDNMTLDGPFEKLIEDTATEMITFDLEDTRKYYAKIVSRAWKQVESMADWEARFKRVDTNIEWLMLEDEWDTSMAGLSTSGRHYHPWWYYNRPYGTYASMPLTSLSSKAPIAPTTSFGDVASSIAGRMENVASSAIDGIDGLGATSKGGLDLSAFDEFTMDTLKSMADSTGSGGSGGGCACACAGCACACACAGGGR